jgi:hypothetical protein
MPPRIGQILIQTSISPAPPEREQRQAGGSLFRMEIRPSLAVSTKSIAVRRAV